MQLKMCTEFCSTNYANKQFKIPKKYYKRWQFNVAGWSLNVISLSEGIKEQSISLYLKGTGIVSEQQDELVILHQYQRSD